MPYADPKKQKAAKAEWYRKKYANDPVFRAKQDAKRDKWLKTSRGTAMAREQRRRTKQRKNPSLHYERLSLDTQAVEYADLIAALKSAGIAFVDRTWGSWVTVRFAKRHLAKLGVKKVLH